MQAQMLAQGGSRDTARAIYSQMYLGSDDPTVREMAQKRLLQVQWFDERDIIRAAISEYRDTHKQCPVSFRDIADRLSKAKLRFDRSGVPVDPANFPYQLIQNGCDVALNENSEVPAK
jgi:hypothetical protein